MWTITILYLVIFGIGSILGILLAFYGNGLLIHLSKHKRKRFKEFNPLEKYGTIRNPFNTILKFSKYIVNNLDINNDTIFSYKRKLRPILKYIYIDFKIQFALFLIFLILEILSVLL